MPGGRTERLRAQPLRRIAGDEKEDGRPQSNTCHVRSVCTGGLQHQTCLRTTLWGLSETSYLTASGYEYFRLRSKVPGARHH